MKLVQGLFMLFIFALLTCYVLDQSVMLPFIIHARKIVPYVKLFFLASK